MKKLRKTLAGFCLATVLMFSVAPASVVRADESGPQGTSNSTTTKPPPPPPPPPSSADLLQLLVMLLMWLFG